MASESKDQSWDWWHLAFGLLLTVKIWYPTVERMLGRSEPVAVPQAAAPAASGGLPYEAGSKWSKYQNGDLRMQGGSPTVRVPYALADDDPLTSNDESNDQPRGHFGTLTLSACNLSSGNCYPLDGDVSGTELHRLYFPRGGWIDFLGCDLDVSLTGVCEDEQGRSWQIDGED